MKSIRLRRSIAFIIDIFIIGTMVGIFDSLFSVMISSKTGLTLDIFLAPVFYIIYFVIFDVIRDSCSIKEWGSAKPEKTLTTFLL